GVTLIVRNAPNVSRSKFARSIGDHNVRDLPAKMLAYQGNQFLKNQLYVVRLIYFLTQPFEDRAGRLAGIFLGILRCRDSPNRVQALSRADAQFVFDRGKLRNNIGMRGRRTYYATPRSIYRIPNRAFILGSNRTVGNRR